jgi:hypothetical protein
VLVVRLDHLAVEQHAARRQLPGALPLTRKRVSRARSDHARLGRHGGAERTHEPDRPVSRIAAAAARRPTIVVPLSGFVRLSSERTIEACARTAPLPRSRSLPRVRTIGQFPRTRSPNFPRWAAGRPGANVVDPGGARCSSIKRARRAGRARRARVRCRTTWWPSSSSSSGPRIRNSTSAPRPDHGRPPTLCRQASRSRPTVVGPAIRSQRVSDKMRLVW